MNMRNCHIEDKKLHLPTTTWKPTEKKVSNNKSVWKKKKEYKDTVVYARTIGNLQQSVEIEKSLIYTIFKDTKKPKEIFCCTYLTFKKEDFCDSCLRLAENK